MASNHAMLLLLCGEIWKSLSTAIPLNPPGNNRNAYSSIRSPAEDKAPLYQLQAIGHSSDKSGGAQPATTSPPFPEAHAEPSDGGWITALIIGIVLISMIVAMMIILLWKCCKRPALVDSNWAGRSPFADGDTPDVFMDSDQAPKRSSLVFMLPWKPKQDTHLQHDPIASEKPSTGTAGNEASPPPPPAPDCSEARVPVPNAETTPAPTPAAGCAPDACPHPTASPEPPDLPPPPDWLQEPGETHGSEPSKHQEPCSETEEPLPPPPASLVQDFPEPPPQLPPPAHPL
ncbi:EVI2B protein, partial [Syrrhaptes paradoxus]|nr:EVI2B protein [Syrrhaptes paradoxus]